MKKQVGFKTKGMNRDMSVSAFNQEFAFENMNLRLSTNEGNTLMSWVNEKGTSPITISRGIVGVENFINGCVVGTAVLNHFLILFLTKCWDEGTKDYYDSIVRLKYEGTDKNSMVAKVLYSGLEKGNLGFMVEHPLETLVSFESDHIQKVYWTDGINQPRLINIAPENDGHIGRYTNTSFDFIPTLQLNEDIHVKKILGGGGMFAPGVIQYAFTYYNRYGQESNIFYTTPLYYISYADRGASPEDKVDNVFRITVDKPDSNFDYLRIYSIQRTSINSTPMCKRIQDIEVAEEPKSVSFTDTGTAGDSIDPTELLYKGGHGILVGTMEQKDGTLFMGDIVTPSIKHPKAGVSLETSTRTFYPNVVSTDSYEYANQLTSYKDATKEESVPCAGFKKGNFYRCGVQFQDEHGRWSDPVFLENVEIDISPEAVTNVKEEPEGTYDFELREVIIANNSQYPLVISNIAKFALVGKDGKFVFTVKLGNFDSRTIESGMQDVYNKAVILDAKKYSGLKFCTKDEYTKLGMESNVSLKAYGSKRGYVLTPITAGTAINSSSTYTIECTESFDPAPQEVPFDEDLDGLLMYFNPILKAAGTKEITNTATPLTYAYLKAAYDLADTEWSSNAHSFFSATTYPEIYNGSDYRGTNDTYEKNGTSQLAMQSWLVAMCLSELAPTSGTNTNTQTELFKKAYNLIDGSGDGKKVPLYGGYTLKGDPMIARYAAGAIYALNRAPKSFSDMQQMRTELWGDNADHSINASDWSGLEYSPDNYKLSMENLGYLVNTDAFLPGAFGPWASGEFYSSFPYGQSSDQYYNSPTEAGRFWEANNYKVDVNIDNTITDTLNGYIAYSPDGNGGYTFAGNKEKLQRLFESAVIGRATDFVFFGRKRLKYTNTIAATLVGHNVSLHRFSETDDSIADSNVYEYTGPFYSEQLQDYLFSNQGTYTATAEGSSITQELTFYERKSPMLFLDVVKDIADNGRYPSHSAYKRIRPCGSNQGGETRAQNQTDALGGFECGSLTSLFADTRDQADAWGAGLEQDDFPGDSYGKSYPSGHSSQVWALAMYLGQMKPSSITEYMRNAYRFSVNRTIARAHWNSDVMYGRMFGTMVLPIINAMSGLQSDYASFKSAMGEGGGDVPSGDVSVNIVIDNQTGADACITGELRIYVEDGTGGYVGMNMHTPKFISGNDTYYIPQGRTEYSSLACSVNGDSVSASSFVGNSMSSLRSPIVYGFDGQNHHSTLFAVDMLSGTFSNDGTYILVLRQGEAYGNMVCTTSRTLSKGMLKAPTPAATRSGEDADAPVETIEVIESPKADMTVTVPTIKGLITSEEAKRLYREEGYRKVRAVVVYPDMQNRKVICQGVACPTLYTLNNRGEGSSDELQTKSIYAQSSWFFRPRYSNTKYSEDTNVPASAPGDYIGYMNAGSSSTLAVISGPVWTITVDGVQGCNPTYIKRTEVQGSFNPGNKFKVEWRTLTYHVPDIVFDDSMLAFDYGSGGLDAYQVGNVSFVRTLSDIDIRTETPTISKNASGFIKKSFVRGDASGIIAGLFYEDYAVNDSTGEKEEKFKPFVSQSVPMKWMVYPWNRTGSLNNDISRPAGYGVQTAVLKQKIISNLRVTNSVFEFEGDKSSLGFKAQLFYSNEPEIIKLDLKDSKGSNIYMGNIDTMLIPDEPDGLYFSICKDPDDEYAPTPQFTDKVYWKTFAKNNKTGETSDKGAWYFGGDSWERMDTCFGQDLGDEYTDTVLSKGQVRMKYKSTPHLVLTGSSSLATYNTEGCLPILELRRNIERAKAFGGNSKDILHEQLWIPCGEPVRLWEGPQDEPAFKDVEFEYSWGDTYYQRWDCLKTYAFTPEDINQVVEIGSFMLETYVNIDGRYDRNRGQLSNLYMSPQNFNLLNPVYSQLNNFFTYRIQDDEFYKLKKYPNQITWSKTKTSGADVDMWTNVTLASILELDGDKGTVRKLIRFNNYLFSFQDMGISQILYNDNVQINAADGVPIEIANSGKVQGKDYKSDTIGCSNKWSLVKTPSGIYFMDSVNKGIFMFNGQVNNLSGSLGMNTWCKENIPDSSVDWTPYDYLIKNDDTEIFVNGFQNFVAYYDKLNQDILFINKQTALAFSERLGTFTSFYDYGETSYLCNLQDTGLWLKVGTEEKEGVDTKPHVEYTTALWKHQGGEYCKFFGESKSYWMTLVGNPEPQFDKIFTNLEFRASVDGDGELNRYTGKFTPALPFDSLETWNEYQHGIANLANMRGHDQFRHHTTDNNGTLKRKFRIWRCDIPRDNAELNTDAALGIFRKTKPRRLDRMRNPWLYLKLQKDAADTMPRTEIHDIVVSYFL